MFARQQEDMQIWTITFHSQSPGGLVKRQILIKKFGVGPKSLILNSPQVMAVLWSMEHPLCHVALWEAVEDEAPEVAQIPVGSLVFSQFWSIPDGENNWMLLTMKDFPAVHVEQ